MSLNDRMGSFEGQSRAAGKAEGWRPSGQELFAALTPAEQNKAIGPEAAALVRDDDADLKDFVSHSKTDSDQPNWITQKPAQDVTE